MTTPPVLGLRPHSCIPDAADCTNLRYVRRKLKLAEASAGLSRGFGLAKRDSGSVDLSGPKTRGILILVLACDNSPSFEALDGRVVSEKELFEGPEGRRMGCVEIDG